MTSRTDIAIIGAGPYGLSIAAHLRAAGVPFLIFGEPMATWRSRMPRGMHLKSQGFASSLFDPERKDTLRNYCADHDIRYDDTRVPVALETFWTYGMTFQKKRVPSLDTRSVNKLERSEKGFTLTLSDGQRVHAQRVIVATGISYYEYLPDEISHLPRSVCSHTADNADLSIFKNREILVLGRGASSTDVAALLVQHGASVQIVSREPVEFHNPPGAKPRSIWARMRNPDFGLGPNFRSAVYTLFPALFHFVPLKLRQRIVARHLGPSAVYFIKDILVGHVPMHSGYALRSAEVKGDRVHVGFTGRDGTPFNIEADHLISGTGYRVDLAKLPFMDPNLLASVEREGLSPRLSLNFESSVPGLYFVGVASALAFGPLTRFAHGAGYTARRISTHLRRRRSALPVEDIVTAQS